MCGPSQNLPQEGRAFTGIDTDTHAVTVTHGEVVPDTFANSQDTRTQSARCTMCEIL